MTLACVILHNICIDRGDLTPRVLDLSYDSTTSKRRDKAAIGKLLDLTDARQKNSSSEEVKLLVSEKQLRTTFGMKRNKQYHDKIIKIHILF